MDQQVIALICLCIVVASLIASYVKHRRKGVEAAEEHEQSIQGVMDEAFSYFGVEPSKGDSVTRTLDLAPFELAGGMVTRRSRKARSGRKER